MCNRARALGLLVSLGLIAALLAACGGGEGAPATAMERCTQVLGHAPRGLARTAAKSGTLIVATADDYPPQSWVNDDGKLIGFDVEVARRVGALLNLDVSFITPEWDAVPAALSRGKVQVSIGSLAPTEELEQTLAFSRSYYSMPARIAVKEGSAKLDGVADLAGKSVGVGVQTAYFFWLRDNTEAVVKAYTADADTFTELAAGRLDAIVTAGPTLAQAIRAGQPFQLVGSPLFSQDLAFAVRADETDLLALMNFAIRSLRGDGSLGRLSREWFGGLDLSTPAR